MANSTNVAVLDRECFESEASFFPQLVDAKMLWPVESTEPTYVVARGIMSDVRPGIDRAAWSDHIARSIFGTDHEFHVR